MPALPQHSLLFFQEAILEFLTSLASRNWKLHHLWKFTSNSSPSPWFLAHGGGKAKLVDILSKDFRFCARAAGGHTIVANGVTYDFHLLPSGLMNPECTNLTGSGVMVHGLPNIRERIKISDRCHVILDLYQMTDALEEVELGSKSVRTTMKGIGPAYSTKASRSGIRISKIFNEGLFEEKMGELANVARKLWGDRLRYDVEEEIERFKQYRTDLKPYMVDAIQLIQSAQQSCDILIEGGNALMLDLDYGTYPYVTSSSTTIGGIISGLCTRPSKDIEHHWCGQSLYHASRRVSSLTKDLGEIGAKLQDIGREVGVTTGRKRRCGWLDLVKYSTSINYYSALNITELDILDTFPIIKVAISYRDPLTGETLPSFPANLEILE
ncbi:P-loop containing nucleoside triphosphate hydrolase protein [Acephala macrosclerotiorum]|nr:P-loop containing nucleoside triphosphate hydrolase protein [Acephala macrosclerotiorum]